MGELSTLDWRSTYLYSFGVSWGCQHLRSVIYLCLANRVVAFAACMSCHLLDTSVHEEVLIHTLFAVKMLKLSRVALCSTYQQVWLFFGDVVFLLVKRCFHLMLRFTFRV